MFAGAGVAQPPAPLQRHEPSRGAAGTCDHPDASSITRGGRRSQWFDLWVEAAQV